MHLRPPSWTVLGVAFASAALGACASEPAGGDPGAAADDVAPLVQSNVRVLDAEPGVDLQLHDADLVGSASRFPDLAAAVPGDILVSGRGSGFLRRVRSIRTDGDHVVAETEPASLEDVFHQVHVRGTINGDVPAATAPVGTPGIGMRGVRLQLPQLALSGKRIAIGQGSELEIVDGSFSFQPELDFDLTMHGGKVEHVKVLAAGESNARLHVRYHLSKAANLQSGLFVRMSDGVPVLETPPCYAVFWAGSVPIVVSVRARLLAGWELLVGGDVTGEQDMSADGSVSAGLEYSNGGWRDLASKSLSVSHAGTTKLTSHSVSGDMTLMARLDVSFYELAGPYVGLQAYAGVKHEGSSDASGWFFQEGLRGIAGAQVAVFGRSVAGYQSVLFDMHEQQPMP
jgi:hypothetical protein